MSKWIAISYPDLGLQFADKPAGLVRRGDESLVVWPVCDLTSLDTAMESINA